MLTVPNHVLSLPRELAGEFFLAFSRFEFALKASGFARQTDRGIEPDWDGFADSIHGSFDPAITSDLKAAVEYLRSPAQTIPDGRQTGLGEPVSSNRSI